MMAVLIGAANVRAVRYAGEGAESVGGILRANRTDFDSLIAPVSAVRHSRYE
jgi:RNase P/RNase MRP subunit POP5